MIKKFFAGALSVCLLFGAVACGETDVPPDDWKDPTDEPSVEEPATQLPSYGWNTEPVATGVFYDDFSEGISNERWSSDDRGWGLGDRNNGVTSKNISYSTDAEKVEAAGATGGIVVMQANGAYASDPYKGAVLITRDDFGAGKYEVRLKVLPRQGQCTALWTYFNGTSNLTEADSLDDSKYSEIDVELPEGGDFRQLCATTYSKYISKKKMDQTTAKVNLEKAGLGKFSLNDGEWHTLSFEWRTAENDTGIIWYVDGRAVMKHVTSVPEYTATFWIGTHFPDIPSWLGVPDFETAYMYVDWVKITSYDEPTTDECVRPAAENETQFDFRDLGSSDIPQTNYIANSDFSRYEKATPSLPYVWETETGSEVVRETENYVSYLLMEGDSGVFQRIDSKYIGHKVRLVVTAEVIEGDGGLNAYVEEYYSALSRGKSDVISFKHKLSVTKELTYTITNEKSNLLRVVLETDAGTKVKVTSVKLYVVN